MFLSTFAFSQNRLRIAQQLQLSAASGSIIVTSGSNKQEYLVPGSDGQVLQIVGGFPTWVTAAGGGGMVDFDLTDGTTTETVSNGETITFVNAGADGFDLLVSATNNITFTYDFLELANISPIDNAVDRFIVYDNSAALYGYVTVNQFGTIVNTNYAEDDLTADANRAHTWNAFNKAETFTSGDYSIATTGESNMFHIDGTNGRLGIGTASPNAKVHIVDNGLTTTSVLNVRQDDANPFGLLVGNNTYSANINEGVALWVSNAGVASLDARGTGATIDLTIAGTAALTVNNSSELQFNQYGAGSITGTATYFLGVDASGNVIEEPIAGGGTVTAADNGVSLSATTVQLGHAATGTGASDFTANRYLYLDGFDLAIESSGAPNTMHIDGGTGHVGINDVSPSSKMTIHEDYSGVSQTNNQSYSLQLANVDATANNWTGINFAADAAGTSAASVQTRFTDHASQYGELHFSTRGASSGFVTKMLLSEEGALSLSQYGSGTFTGTATYILAVDASGNVIEEDVANALNNNYAEADLTADANRAHIWSTFNQTETFTTGDFTIANSGDASAFFIDGATAALQFGDYGSGANTGTATYILAVDASGVMIEEPLPSAATVTAADNGVSLSATTVQLGHAASGTGASDFTANRYLFTGAFDLEIGSTAAAQTFVIDGGTGTAAIGGAASGGFGLTVHETDIQIINTSGAAAMYVSGLSNSTSTIWLGNNDVDNEAYGIQANNFGAEMYFFVDGAQEMTIESGGQTVLNSYGSGTFTGTATYVLAVDASGNIIEENLSGGTVVTAADNGVSLSGATVQLGQPASGSGASDFTAHRYLHLDEYDLFIGGNYGSSVMRIDGDEGLIGFGTGVSSIYQFNFLAQKTDLGDRGMLIDYDYNNSIGGSNVASALFIDADLGTSSTNEANIYGLFASVGGVLHNNTGTDVTVAYLLPELVLSTINNQTTLDLQNTNGGTITTDQVGLFMNTYNSGTISGDRYMMLLSHAAGGTTTGTDYGIYVEGEDFLNVFAGNLQLSKYGGGTETGTPTYFLTVDASGNVIEEAIGGGGVLTGADNGVSISSATVQLGHTATGTGVSDFTANRYLFLAGFDLEVGSAGDANHVYFDGSTGFTAFGNSAPDARVHIYKTGTTGLSGYANDTELVLQNSTGAGEDIHIGLVADAAGSAGITFGDEADVSTGSIRYHNSSESLQFIVNNTSGEFNLLDGGQMQFNNYGSGTHTGTAVYILATDASGNVIEETIGGGGGLGVNIYNENGTIDDASREMFVDGNTFRITGGDGSTPANDAASFYMQPMLSGRIRIGDVSGDVNGGGVQIRNSAGTSDVVIGDAFGHAVGTSINADFDNFGGTIDMSAPNGITLDAQLDFEDYGSGSITGTATYLLAVDASGNVIEESVGGGGVPTAADNGIQISSNTIQLGSTSSGSGALDFTADRYLYIDDFLFTIGTDDDLDNFVIDGNSGNIGINTNTPASEFEVHGTIATGGHANKANYLSVVLFNSQIMAQAVRMTLNFFRRTARSQRRQLRQ